MYRSLPIGSVTAGMFVRCDFSNRAVEVVEVHDQPDDGSVALETEFPDEWPITIPYGGFVEVWAEETGVSIAHERAA